jgi:prepilin-type N-terminal cleavage/methylation domain-containing protein
VNRKRCSNAGVTLIEMMIVVTLIGLLVGLTFPSVSSGIDTLRLNEASNETVSFFNDALTRAVRREQAIEITISKGERTLSMHSPDQGFEKKLALPQGVSIAAVLPEREQEEADAPRQFMVYPGGAVPGIGVEIVNARGVHRVVRVDPITGVARIQEPEAQ